MADDVTPTRTVAPSADHLRMADDVAHDDCCGGAEQAMCCAPSEKSDCCGTPPGCGCKT